MLLNVYLNRILEWELLIGNFQNRCFKLLLIPETQFSYGFTQFNQRQRLSNRHLVVCHINGFSKLNFALLNNGFIAIFKFGHY